ncbi:DUF624 domain-containing protein [Streptococcus hillyeri]|uniref:DUF624 domain-containing protein n=1 Tax=Streptococcus hillyeri TaxID=2282420 RepID=A0A3L9DW69_9STRE|nr:DUF624 domain-containing protein [Streptococcus hillyeri]RLY05345.1 DUF624 domain-containing protein [Streptococcus hillyeri]
MDRLDHIFSRLFFVMKLGMLFVILLLSGGVILGFSPAATVLLTLYHEHRLEIDQYQFTEAYRLFRRQFWQANAFFVVIVGLIGLLGYGLFLLVQLPQQLIVLLLMVSNCCLILYLWAVYACYLKLQVYYTFTFVEGLKLSSIAVFLGLVPFVKLGIGTAICLFIGWKVSLIIGVFIPILWLLFLFDTLEPIYHQVEQKMME